MSENLKTAFIVLLTGIVVVFFVLLLLICIIKLYGTIVHGVEDLLRQRREKETARKESIRKSDAPLPSVVTGSPPAVKPEAVDDGAIPSEIIAVIAAAASVALGGQPVRIKSVKRAYKSRSAWRSAGVAENNRAF